MRFVVTLAASDGEQDVALSAPPATTAHELRQALRPACGTHGVDLPDDVQLRHGAVVGEQAEVLSIGAEPSSGLTLDVAGGACAGAVIALAPGDHSIGRDPSCDIVLDDARVSRRHAVLSVGRDRTSIRDLASTNGTEIDDASVMLSATVPVSSLVRIGDTLLRLRHVGDERRAPLRNGDGRTVVVRTPRAALKAAAAAVEIPDEPRHRSRWWRALLSIGAPTVGALLLAWLTGNPQLLLFAVLGPLMMLPAVIGSGVGEKRGNRSQGPLERRRRRRAAAAATGGTATAATVEPPAHQADAPDPPTIECIARLPTDRLWERSVGDGIVVRLGTGRSTGNATTPVLLEIAGTVGITGPQRVVAACARWLVGQLAVLYPPRELALVLLTADADEQWRWARWLPHFAGRFACSPQGVAACLSAIRNSGANRRRVVVLATSGDTARRTPGVNELATITGVSTLWLGRGLGGLPACHAVLRLDDPWGSRASLRVAPTSDEPGSARVVVQLVADLVDARWIQRLARRLAPLRDTDVTDGVGDGLVALLGRSSTDPAAIVARWRRSDGGGATVIGRGRDGPVRLDLVGDGPHALIAGTTGSGKSVLLRTLVTGLALSHPPDEMAFLLVDYKGGAAFAACAELPHTVGVLTDLDSHLTERALRSLAAEIERRERLFASAGVEDLNGFRRTAPDNAPARLVIVVDEFATLAEDLPDFVPGLVGVAQRGRSLGVHLVLATQRPGRIVSPEIRANTSLRISLRAVAAADSVDVVDSPEAAAFPAAEPGWALLRAGTETVTFRVADVGAAPVTAVGVEALGPWHQSVGGTAAAASYLDEVVRSIRVASRESRRRTPARPWLPPLPDRLELDLDARTGSRLPLGRIDLPDRCVQPELDLELSTCTSAVVCGDVGAGTSTALVTIALQAAAGLPPDACEIYAAGCDDGRGALLRALPHAATVLSREADDMVDPMLRLLRETAAKAHRLLLLDDWDSVLRNADETAAARLQDELARLVRDAHGLRMTVVVGGGRALLRSRFAPAAEMVWLLRLADRNDYALAGVAPASVPVRLPPGRGVRTSDGAEFQLGCFADPAATAQRIARRWSGSPRSQGAVRLRALPEEMPLADCGPPGRLIRLGVCGWDARPVGIDLTRSGHLLVAGPPRSGRTSVLVLVLAECRRLGVTTVVAAAARSPLHRLAGDLDGAVVTPGSVGFQPPSGPAVLLVDDVEQFAETAVGDALAQWLQTEDATAVVAGRSDELATAFRGIVVTARRNRRGILLQPRPLDGELLGVRLDRGRPAPRLPGRGVLVGLPVDAAAGDALPIQLAFPDQPPDMWG